MKWLLIIVTFYNPHVDLKIVEIEVDTQEQCLSRMAYYMELFDNQDDAFGYTMRCEEVGDES